MSTATTGGSPVPPGNRPSGPALSRRTLATGAVWAVPAVAAAAAAPQVSASACVPTTLRVEPTLVDPGQTTTVPYTLPTYSTTPLVVTIPPYSEPCPITFTIRGGDGSRVGGSGILATGTITRSDNNKYLTLTLIAGAKGQQGNAQFTDGNTGGVGYGRGGSGTWLGYGAHGAGNNHAHSTAGGGLLGTATNPSQTTTTALVVAGGGGGGSSIWTSGSNSGYEVSGVAYAGVAQAPGATQTAAFGQHTDRDATPERPFGRVSLGDTTGVNPGVAYGYVVGFGGTAAAPAIGTTGATGGAAAHVSTSNVVGTYGGLPTNGTASGGIWTYTNGASLSNQYAWNSQGTSGGNHATGMYGGGNGGNGNTAPPNAPDSISQYVPGGSGGGGYAGGGGGLSIVANTDATGGITGSVHGAWGSAGGAGSSHLTTSATNPNGGTVTISNVTWTQQGFTDVDLGGGYINPQHGYVEIHVG